MVFCLLASSALAFIAAGGTPLIGCLLLGLAIGPPPGVITALPTKVLQPADRAAGFGVFYTCHSLLQATGPAIAGWLHDAAGGSMASVVFGAAMFMVPLPLLAIFEWLLRQSRAARRQSRLK